MLILVNQLVGTLNLSLHITQLLQMERCISLIRAYL